MKLSRYFLLAVLVSVFVWSCKEESKLKEKTETTKQLSAKDILGNPDYLAMSYGGYRNANHDIEPTVAELKEDMKLMHAMGVRLLRTYKVHLPHASNVLKAISEIKKEDSNFEMYVMLGAWINCENAWTENPNHEKEDEVGNTGEIERIVKLANQYPNIVKVIAVGNEAMVHWAATYFVRPNIILKWVNHLQGLKQTDKLPKDIWITSSDNFAAWGGDGKEYHQEDLEKLIKAVDYVSLHIYPMHETHYKPDFWGVFEGEEKLSDIEKIEVAMNRARDFGIAQYQRTVDYFQSLGIEKPIHIGETGWASSSNGFYGDSGTKATDEYKEGLYYKLIRDWTAEKGMACFYFEAFNENWKDEKNPGGSENYFGLFDMQGQAKYAIWDLVDKGAFEGLTNRGNKVVKTFEGDKAVLLKEVQLPPSKGKLLGKK